MPHYQGQGKFSEAENVYLKSLDMEYNMHGKDAMRAGIAVSPANLESFIELKES